jgi:hypothetical protein
LPNLWPYPLPKSRNPAHVVRILAQRSHHRALSSNRSHACGYVERS